MKLTFLTGYLKLLLSIVLRMKSKLKQEILILGPDNKSKRKFVDLYNQIDLIKTIIRLKGTGSYIDLLLAIQKYSFKNKNAFETGLSGHHFLIHSVLKTSFQENEQKTLIYRDYTSFSKCSFLNNLSISIKNCQSYDAFEIKTFEVLGRHVP